VPGHVRRVSRRLSPTTARVDPETAALVGLGVLLPQLVARVRDRPADYHLAAIEVEVGPASARLTRRQPVGASTHRYRAEVGILGVGRGDELLHCATVGGVILRRLAAAAWRRGPGCARSSPTAGLVERWRLTVVALPHRPGNSPRPARSGRARLDPSPHRRDPAAPGAGRRWRAAIQSYDDSVTPPRCGASRRATGRAVAKGKRRGGEWRPSRPRRPPARPPLGLPSRAPHGPARRSGARPRHPAEETLTRN